MSKHHDHQDFSSHTNGFIDLNGIPYILAEYVDRQGFMQIDRSAIRSNIYVDTSDAMRAVIDISIDDIGKRCNGEYLNITGNSTKQKRLIDMISKYKEDFSHQLPVIRKGIVVRVNYRVENYKTQQVLRTTNEDFRIADRNYFIDINPRDIEDNGIICNFEHSAISTINEFTHGREKMVLRVTSVELFYDFVKNGHKGPHIKQSTAMPVFPYGMDYDDSNPYKYHHEFQHDQFIGECDDFSCQKPEPITPPTWSNFNRFYHFANDNQDLILHNQEIYDPNLPTGLIPCGKCRVNRAFIINPGHRLIFKFSIWKNDVTIVNNSRKIAKALEVPALYHHYHGHHHDGYDFDNKENIKDMIRDILRENREEDKKQNELINQLLREIEYLKHRPEPPIERPPHHHDHKHGCDHSETNEHLEDIEDLLHQLINKDTDDDSNNGDNECGCNHEHTSITVSDIRNIIEEIKNEENM